MKEITADELNKIVNDGIPSGDAVVDVRTGEECQKGIIKGALQLPVDQIPVKGSELMKYNNLYFYCLSGSRSQMAAMILEANGFKGNVYSLQNGLMSWRLKKFPLELPTQKICHF